MTIGMGLVGRAGGKFQPAPNHGRAPDIERRFDPVRDQDVGMTERARHNLGRGQDDIRDHPEEGDARARSEIAGRSVRGRMRGHRDEREY